MFVRSVLFLAASVAATAAYGAAPAAPPVSGGDMTCFVATSYMAAAAEKASEAPDKDADFRASAAKVAAINWENNAFYLGRLGLLPAEQRSVATYQAADQAFSKLDTDGKVKAITACNDWAKQAKIAVITPWNDK